MKPRKLNVEGFESCEIGVDSNSDDTVYFMFTVDDGGGAAGFKFSRTFKNRLKAKSFFKSVPNKMTEAKFDKYLENGFEE